MRTIFALFEGYARAREAVEELRSQGFDVDEMNAIVYAEVARGAMDVDLRTASVEATDELGARTLYGLDRLLATKQPVPLPPVGEVLAAGELARILVATAGAAGAADGGLSAALVDLGVPRETAEAYQRGIANGGLLFWVRIDDERAAAAREIVEEHHGMRVGAYP